MSSASLVLAMALALTARAFDLQGDISPDPKHFLHKYALLKLYESCFGQELLYKMKMRMKEATDKCSSASSPDTRPVFINRNHILHQYVAKTSDDFAQSKSHDEKQQPQVSPPRFPPIWTAAHYYNEALKKSSMGEKESDIASLYYTQPVPLTFHNPAVLYRGKRQSSRADSELSNLKGDVLSKLGNVTCVLREVGILTADGQINVKGLKQEYTEMEIDEVMKRDLKDGVDTCAQFAHCIASPTDQKNRDFVSMNKHLAPSVIMFVNCLKGKRMEACIKKDLRERLVALVQDGKAPDDASDILGREGSSEELEEDDVDMETFIFAMLYEDEPSSIFR